MKEVPWIKALTSGRKAKLMALDAEGNRTVPKKATKKAWRRQGDHCSSKSTKSSS